MKSIFSKRLTELLEEHDMSQVELSKKLDITNVTISRYLSDTRKPRIEIVTKLADYFGISADYLLGLSNEKEELKDNILKYTTTDESMSPLLNVGDVAYIEKKSTYDSGDTILFTLEDKKYIRKIIDKEKEVELIAMNIYFPKMILSKNDFVAKKFSVVGKVIRAEIKF